MLIFIKKLIDHTIKLPNSSKKLLLFFLDGTSCFLATWLAFSIRLGVFSSLTSAMVQVSLFSAFLFLGSNSAFGIYKLVNRFADTTKFVRFFSVFLLYSTIFILIFVILGQRNIPRTIGLLQPLLLFIIILSSRSFIQSIFTTFMSTHHRSSTQSRALIYGAGHEGTKFERALKYNTNLIVLGFLDDDKNLHGRIVNGLQVYHPEELEKIKTKLNISTILLAMPNLSKIERKEKVNNILSHSLQARILPSINEIVGSSRRYDQFLDIQVEELLEREPSKPIQKILKKNITNKVILVTGAGGSIGGELCLQISALSPKTIVLLEQNEFALYELNERLQSLCKNKKFDVIPILTSIRDKKKINQIFSSFRPDTVFHAAAYKHVPIVEANMDEAIKTNIFGTKFVAQAAKKNNAKTVVLISSDKAVRPTNIMGATKRVAELIFQNEAKHSKNTVFTMVRFGNVLGSSGSVVPKIESQIKNGGPVTITHSKITRYFMTISEASQLVIQSSAMAKGGEVFLLDMGKPINILELAKKIILLSGKSFNTSKREKGDIEIIFTGLRPGEKLYEELLIGKSSLQTDHPRIFKANEEVLDHLFLSKKLCELEKAIQINAEHLMYKTLRDLVPEFNTPKN